MTCGSGEDELDEWSHDSERCWGRGSVPDRVNGDVVTGVTWMRPAGLSWCRDGDAVLITSRSGGYEGPMDPFSNAACGSSTKDALLMEAVVRPPSEPLLPVDPVVLLELEMTEGALLAWLLAAAMSCISSSYLSPAT